ncbi:MAG TPA: hypothetical protein VK590_07465 [Saprospiraceae bacterium]|nr:hypothetical protein [Saprospiraceae bacterium]
MDKKEVLEQLVKGLKEIKDDLQKKEVKEAVSDMKSAVGAMKESVGKLPTPKEKMAKDMMAEITKKVNTGAAMKGLKQAAGKNLAARAPDHNPPPSNEVTKKVMKSSEAEKTKEDSPGKSVEKIAQGSKSVSDASKNLQDKDNYPAHTQDKAKKKGLSPFMLARKSKEAK